MSIKWPIGIVASILVVLAVGYTVRFLQTGVSQGSQIPEQSKVEIPNANPKSDAEPLIIGDKNAPVTMIEYADFKCPECGKFHSDVGKRIRADYVDTGKVKIEFRPYPVYAADGGKALAGSYCAWQQSKFPEYHDALFTYMWDNHFKKGDYQKAIDPVLTDEVMASILSNIGMNKQKYDTCLEDPETRNAYEADIFEAAPDEIQGTPSFVINGKKIVGNQPYEVFSTILDIQL